MIYIYDIYIYIWYIYTFAYPSEQATRYSFRSFSAVNTSKSPGQRCSLAAASTWTRFFREEATKRPTLFIRLRLPLMAPKRLSALLSPPATKKQRLVSFTRPCRRIAWICRVLAWELGKDPFQSFTVGVKIFVKCDTPFKWIFVKCDTRALRRLTCTWRTRPRGRHDKKKLRTKKNFVWSTMLCTPDWINSSIQKEKSPCWNENHLWFIPHDKSQSAALSMYPFGHLTLPLNTGYITGLDMCKVCTEAVHSVALWTRVSTCFRFKYVQKQAMRSKMQKKGVQEPKLREAKRARKRVRGAFQGRRTSRFAGIYIWYIYIYPGCKGSG